MAEINFKERVKNTAISCAKIYKETFVDYEYLICSQAFEKKKYYITKADAGNYLHLLGIHTELKPADFFAKCYEGTLAESDFDFIKKNQSEQSVKGSVRQKIKVLPDMMQIYEKELIAQEFFKKNKVECAFATAESNYTVGYAAAGRPKTLLQKNVLDSAKSKKVDLVFRKKRCEDKYCELVMGKTEDILIYLNEIKDYLDEKFIGQKADT